jgi:CubicO group peptidase (beta-lactamase class C family)
VAALCLLMLVSRGSLDFDDRVSAHWPQFAQAGKEDVTVRQLLGHRAGLAAIARDLGEGALYDWDVVTTALAEQAPWWTPGTGHGYHVHTFGFLVGELVRRVSSEPIGAFLRAQLAEPLDAEMSLGLADGKRARRADYVFDTALSARFAERERSDVDERLRERAYLNPPGAMGLGTVNTAAWQDAELPSANLHADARAIARMYAALVQDVPSIIDREVLLEAITEASAGIDLVLGRPSRFGLGFQLTQAERPLGPNAHSFGHFGAGGSVGFGDRDAGVAFAYVMNRGGPQWRDPRNSALIDAVYESLGGGS